MYLYKLAVWCLLICATSVTTFERKDRHIAKPKTENWVEPTVNAEVISLLKNNEDLLFKFWGQRHTTFGVPVLNTKDKLSDKFQFQRKENRKSNVTAPVSLNGKTYRPKQSEENIKSVSPLTSENGIVTRPNTNDMRIAKLDTRYSKPIEDHTHKYLEKDLSDLSHLMDEFLNVAGKGSVRPNRLSHWLSQPKREDITLKDIITNCAPGEIKLTKTFVCVPCTAFVDLEDNVCEIRHFQLVCVETWTKTCGLDRAKRVPASIRNPKDYDALN